MSSTLRFPSTFSVRSPNISLTAFDDVETLKELVLRLAQQNAELFEVLQDFRERLEALEEA